MERTFIRRGDYPNNSWTPYRWHLLLAERLVVSDNDQQEWHAYAACRRYEIPQSREELTIIDLAVPGEEEPDDVCKWCLGIIRTLDAESISDESYRLENS